MAKLSGMNDEERSLQHLRVEHLRKERARSNPEGTRRIERAWAKKAFHSVLSEDEAICLTTYLCKNPDSFGKGNEDADIRSPAR